MRLSARTEAVFSRVKRQVRLSTSRLSCGDSHPPHGARERLESREPSKESASNVQRPPVPSLENGNNDQERPSSPFENGNGKKGEASAEDGGRFQELLRALADERSRELEAQKAEYQKRLTKQILALRTSIDKNVHANGDRNSEVSASGGKISCLSDVSSTGKKISCLSDVSSTGKKISCVSDLSVPGITMNGMGVTERRMGESEKTNGEEQAAIESPGTGLSWAVPSIRVSQPGDAVIPYEHHAPFRDHNVRPPSPAEPPPSLPVSPSDLLPGTAQLIQPALCTQDEDLRKDDFDNIVAVASGSSIDNGRVSVNTNHSYNRPIRPGSDDNDNGRPVNGAVMLSDVCGKWLNLVRMAIDSTSLHVHVPRQVWKEGLNSKYISNAVIAKTASKHLKKMMTKINSDNKVATTSSAMSFSTLMATAHISRFEALDPHSRLRLTWTLIGMLFMVYDLVFLPIQTFEPPYDESTYVINMANQVYWTLDIFCSSVTAVYIKSVLERRLARSARIYARTWLGFDLLVTLPEWYVILHQTTTMQTLRFVRILRFLKLFRLAKFDLLFRESVEIINSPYVLNVIGSIKIMVWLCLFNHVISCVWFGIGNRRGGWVEQFGLSDASKWYQYLSSTHWALSQYQGNSEFVPGTTEELVYTVAFQMMALIILACFVSTLTTNMGQYQELRKEKYSQQHAIRNYLNENSISTNLCVQVNRYVEWHQRQKHRKQQDAEILLVLPTKLLMDLYDEVRGPVLEVHPFFSTFRSQFSRVFRCIIYEALEQVSPCPSELVFAEGDECYQMYFMMSGSFRYEPHPHIGRVRFKGNLNWEDEVDKEDNQVLDNVYESAVFRPIRVGENEWLSEAVLWTDWEHHGNLIALEDCAALMLNAERFAGIVRTFLAARSLASLYARTFVVCLNRFGHTFTDIVFHEDLFDLDDLFDDDPRLSGVSVKAKRMMSRGKRASS